MSMEDDTGDYVERYEDMSPKGKIRLFRQPDGDIIITVVPDPEDCRINMNSPFGTSAEFCTYGGGGQSPHVREALLLLWEAIKKDNEENPQYRNG